MVLSVGSSEQGPRPQYIKDGLTDVQKEPDVCAVSTDAAALRSGPRCAVPTAQPFLLVSQNLMA